MNSYKVRLSSDNPDQALAISALSPEEAAGKYVRLHGIGRHLAIKEASLRVYVGDALYVVECSLSYKAR